MKLRYSRSGGVTGVTLAYEVDWEILPADLRQLLQSIKQRQPEEGGERADDVLHELKFEDGRVIRCFDSLCSPEELELFDRLVELGKPNRRDR